MDWVVFHLVGLLVAGGSTSSQLRSIFQLIGFKCVEKTVTLQCSCPERKWANANMYSLSIVWSGTVGTDIYAGTHLDMLGSVMFQLAGEVEGATEARPSLDFRHCGI